MQRAIDKIDECHSCRCLSERGHLLINEIVEELRHMSDVLDRAEDELHAMIGDEA